MMMMMTTKTTMIVQLAILITILPTIPVPGSRVLPNQVIMFIPISQAIQEWVDRTQRKRLVGNQVHRSTLTVLDILT